MKSNLEKQIKDLKDKQATTETERDALQDAIDEFTEREKEKEEQEIDSMALSAQRLEEARQENEAMQVNNSTIRIKQKLFIRKDYSNLRIEDN